MILVMDNTKICPFLESVSFLLDYFPILFALCLLTNFDTFLRFVLFINRKVFVVFPIFFGHTPIFISSKIGFQVQSNVKMPSYL